jgi:hypothetical protein
MLLSSELLTDLVHQRLSPFPKPASGRPSWLLRHQAVLMRFEFLFPDDSRTLCAYPALRWIRAIVRR